MKMYPDNWRVRLTTALVATACITAALLGGPALGIHGFWPGILAVVVAIIVANLLGGLLCRRLFPPPAGGPLEQEQRDEKR